jgi:RimJ/RimL family protein N-acetyltransferase
MTLQLIPITPDLDFGCHNYEAISELLMDVINGTLETGTTPPWCGYLALTPDQMVVGTGAFKGAPDGAGQAELAWFTFPPYEHKGYGSAIAAELVKVAQATGGASELIALTPPEKGPSTRICEKCGFTFQGQVDDPEEGPGWLWKRGV